MLNRTSNPIYDKEGKPVAGPTNDRLERLSDKGLAAYFVSIIRQFSRTPKGSKRELALDRAIEKSLDEFVKRSRAEVESIIRREF